MSRQDEKRARDAEARKELAGFAPDALAPLSADNVRTLLYSVQRNQCPKSTEIYVAIACPHAECDYVALTCAAIAAHARAKHTTCFDKCKACAKYAAPIKPRMLWARTAACTHAACAHMPAMDVRNHTHSLDRHVAAHTGHAINAMLVASGLVPPAPNAPPVNYKTIAASHAVARHLRNVPRRGDHYLYSACSQVMRNIVFENTLALAFAIGVRADHVATVRTDVGKLAAITLDLAQHTPTASPHYPGKAGTAARSVDIARVLALAMPGALIPSAYALNSMPPVARIRRARSPAPTRPVRTRRKPARVRSDSSNNGASSAGGNSNYSNYERRKSSPSKASTHSPCATCSDDEPRTSPPASPLALPPALPLALLPAAPALSGLRVLKRPRRCANGDASSSASGSASDGRRKRPRKLAAQHAELSTPVPVALAPLFGLDVDVGLRKTSSASGVFTCADWESMHIPIFWSPEMDLL